MPAAIQPAWVITLSLIVIDRIPAVEGNDFNMGVHFKQSHWHGCTSLILPRKRDHLTSSTCCYTDCNRLNSIWRTPHIDWLAVNLAVVAVNFTFDVTVDWQSGGRESALDRQHCSRTSPAMSGMTSISTRHRISASHDGCCRYHFLSIPATLVQSARPFFSYRASINKPRSRLILVQIESRSSPAGIGRSRLEIFRELASLLPNPFLQALL